MNSDDSRKRINSHHTGWLKVNRFRERGFGIIELDGDDASFRDVSCHLHSIRGTSENDIYNLEYRRRLSFRFGVDEKRDRITATDVRILPAIAGPDGSIIESSPPEAEQVEPSAARPVRFG